MADVNKDDIINKSRFIGYEWDIKGIYEWDISGICTENKRRCVI